jgi:hypothetical protein
MAIVKKLLLIIQIILLLSCTAYSQAIQVNPTGVNVNSQNPTVAFLTFGRLNGYRPAEAVWCGELVPATPPAIGLQCNPATIYGSLPARYNQSRASGNDGFTDIMSIPTSVARRAYQAALNGASAGFFYVRHFVSSTGGPDQFVSVTCRMTGGGARVPFALTDVKLSFDSDKPILFIKTGETFPSIKAEIHYNGTGRLKGRWEIVLPGEEPPTEKDLLTEATLPFEERGRQRRYTQLNRFNYFLPPAGTFTLPGPEIKRIPTNVEGQYQILLRIEATDDKEGDSDLVSIGVGSDVVHSGAVAGFSMPTLKYFVGGASNTLGANVASATSFSLTAPEEKAVLPLDQAIGFAWTESSQAALYRLEITDIQGTRALFALLSPNTKKYNAPSWLKEKIGKSVMRWRVVALDQKGKVVAETAWREFKLKTDTVAR